MNLLKISIAISLLLVFDVFAQENNSESGKTKEIVFGQTATFLGPLGLYGDLIKNAINAYFQRVNDAGGVKGFNFRLKSVEDHGDPILASKNIKTLLKNEKIDMFFGCIGTRSILNVLPLIKNKSIAMFFPWAGHKSFEDQNLSHIVNGLGDLRPQLEEIVKKIVDKRKLKKIAIFHADDDFSTESSEALKNILQTRGIEPVANASYNRMTVDVKTAADKLLKSDPKVVICIATSMPTVKLIGNFFKQGHYATEFVGVDSTLFVGDILKDKGAHFCFSSSVPNPQSDQSKIAKQYRQDIDKYYPNDSYNVLSFSYYTSAAIIVEAIKTIEGVVTKEKIISQVEGMKNFNLDGFNVNFDSGTRHAFGSDVAIIND